MKKWISFFLSFLLLWISIQQVGVVIYFKINQEKIEATLCENKTQPQLECHGKCSLKKEWEKSSAKSEKKTNFSSLEITLIRAEQHSFCPFFCGTSLN
ncbi:MAG: hypothetical protein Q3983_01120 [Capnocytophaga sp.]|nr:hypothetical protein [Capnocytophaga sp.]